MKGRRERLAARLRRRRKRLTGYLVRRRKRLADYLVRWAVWIVSAPLMLLVVMLWAYVALLRAWVKRLGRVAARPDADPALLEGVARLDALIRGMIQSAPALGEPAGWVFRQWWARRPWRRVAALRPPLGPPLIRLPEFPPGGSTGYLHPEVLVHAEGEEGREEES